MNTLPFAMEISAAPSWLVLYYGALLGLGTAALAVFLFRFLNGSVEKHLNNISGWSIDWINLGLLLWLMFLSVVGLQMLLSALFKFDSGSETENGAWQLILAGLSMQLGMILAFLLFRKYQGHLFKEKFNGKALPLGKALPAALFYFLAAYPIVLFSGFYWLEFLQFLRGCGLDLPSEPQEMVLSLKNVKSPLAFFTLSLLAVVGAPMVEELIFRGTLYRFLKFRMRFSAAAAASALFFSLVHFNLAGFSSLFVLGLFLCLSYELSGNLKVPILFHALFNLNSIILLQYKAELLENALRGGLP